MRYMPKNTEVLEKIKYDKDNEEITITDPTVFENGIFVPEISTLGVGDGHIVHRQTYSFTVNNVNDKFEIYEPLDPEHTVYFTLVSSTGDYFAYAIKYNPWHNYSLIAWDQSSATYFEASQLFDEFSWVSILQPYDIPNLGFKFKWDPQFLRNNKIYHIVVNAVVGSDNASIMPINLEV